MQKENLPIGSFATTQKNLGKNLQLERGDASCARKQGSRERLN
jgi:hypothetical protein